MRSQAPGVVVDLRVQRILGKSRHLKVIQWLKAKDIKPRDHD
jgi:hypothetical protein